LKALTAVVQQLAYEVHRQGRDAAHERENLVLRLENALLRFERRLPPASPESQASPLAEPGQE